MEAEIVEPWTPNVAQRLGSAIPSQPRREPRAVISLDRATISGPADLATRKLGGRMEHVQEGGKERLLTLAIPRIVRGLSRTADRRLLISPTRTRDMPRLQFGPALARSADGCAESNLVHLVASRPKTLKKFV
jgi:hypothetical protein